MGNGVSHSGSGVDLAELSKHSREIEAHLKKDAELYQITTKLLLLGAGECGKSTVLKQMRILHTNGFKLEEYLAFKEVIASNIINAISNVVKAMEQRSVDFADADSKRDALTILDASLKLSEIQLTKKLAHAISGVWSDGGTRGFLQRGTPACILDDSELYFLDNIDRIAAEVYKPTEQDILRASARTTGIVEVPFEISNRRFRVIDVGGQRSERRKWIHCFENVDAIVFVAAMSDYNLTLKEDKEVNRLRDSLMLFESICNCRWFLQTNIILFLNKKDLLEQKLRHDKLTIAFPDYSGPNEYDSCCSFIAKHFVRCCSGKSDRVYPHFTCATDTKQIQFVLDAVLDMVLDKVAKASALY